MDGCFGNMRTGRRHNVHDDGRLDVVFWVVVDEETVPNSSAAVVAAPDYRPRSVEDLLEGLDEEVSDGAFVILGR
jgi:hypothetical protein